MSFLEILGLIATITGIISFLKNDAKDLFPFLKKSIHIKKLLQIIFKPTVSGFMKFVFRKVFSGLMTTGLKNSLNSFKKNLISVAKYLFAPYKKNPVLNLL